MLSLPPLCKAAWQREAARWESGFNTRLDIAAPEADLSAQVQHRLLRRTVKDVRLRTQQSEHSDGGWKALFHAKHT